MLIPKNYHTNWFKIWIFPLWFCPYFFTKDLCLSTWIPFFFADILILDFCCLTYTLLSIYRTMYNVQCTYLTPGYIYQGTHRRSGAEHPGLIQPSIIALKIKLSTNLQHIRTLDCYSKRAGYLDFFVKNVLAILDFLFKTCWLS